MDKRQLLYGADDEERLVGLHAEGDNKMRLYTRTEQDNVESRTEEFYPFGHFTEAAANSLAEGYSPRSVDSLTGAGGKDRLVTFSTQKQFWSARGWLRDKVDRSEYDLNASLTSQYLQWTGKTVFGGMTMDDIVRMQIDLEVQAPSGKFPNAERREDEIIMVSITTNRGLRLVLHQSPPSGSLTSHEDYDTGTFREVAGEKQLIREVVKVVHRYDPDVLEFHNGFGFDLPYLHERADLHGVNLALGRDNKEPKTLQSKKQFAEREQEYTNFICAGRSVIDSYFLAADFDVFARDLPGYGLKELASYFGFAAEDRTYVEGEEITPTWRSDPMRLMKYALDDAIETRKLVDKLGTSTFELAKILPADYQEVMTLGTAGSIEIMMKRTYIEKAEAVPQPEEPDPPAGGYTEVFRRGVFKDCAYADVSSLYPSNMIIYGVQPDSDSLGIFRPLLKLLTDLRLEAKKKMRSMDDGPEKDTIDAKQQAFKVLINSFYGALGFAFFAWNDFEDAAKVTRKGRKILKRLIHEIRDVGGTVVLCDTDGVMFELPEKDMSDDEVDALIGERISSRLPRGIEIDNDGRFERVVSYKRKNYAKIPHGKGLGDIKLTGNSLIGRGVETFLRQYIEHQMKAVAAEDVERMAQVHERVKKAIMNRDLSPDQIAKRGRLKMTMDEYADSPSNLARYEVAKTWEERTGKEAKAGDTHWYYVAGDDTDPTVFKDARLIEDYNEDANRHYLLDRLDNTADIFRQMVTEPSKVFSMEVNPPGQSSLFGNQYDVDGVEIVSEKVRKLPPNPSDHEIEPTHDPS